MKTDEVQKKLWCSRSLEHLEPQKSRSCHQRAPPLRNKRHVGKGNGHRGMGQKQHEHPQQNILLILRIFTED